ncbi:MAG: oligosaccharide flippase family protein [Kiritimatiellaeota bacterium]|nr:oligosaccharide flippase family protein [Kiritimatiellota bacterium]
MLKYLSKFHGRLRQHEGYHFAYDSLVVFIGSGLTSLLYALFHAVVGRLMGATDYAVLAGLMALCNVLGTPAGVVATTMTRYVAEYVHRNDTATWMLLVRRGLWLTTPIALAILGLWCLMAPWLRVELKAPSVAAVIMAGVGAFIGLFGPILSGALQGGRRFGWCVASGVAGAGGRLGLGAILAALGFGVTWLLGAVAGGVLLGVLTMWWPLRHAWRQDESGSPIALPSARAIQGYFWSVLVAQTALLLLMSADMILMARFLDENSLGAYGKAAQLSRIVLVLPAPIAIAMFPRAVNSTNPRLILGPILFTFGICLAAAGFMTLFPKLVLHILYGGAATGPLNVELTRWYVWAIIPLALINLLAPYLWARHATMRTLWLVPVCLAYVAALFAFHQTPQQMILCVLAGGSLACLLLGWLTWHLLRSEVPTVAECPKI